MNFALLGKKILTIRLGNCIVDPSVKYLFDGKRKIKISIKGIEYKLFQDLSEDHAKSEGMENLISLKEDLSTYYGDIDPKQPITLIYFALTDKQMQIWEPLEG